MRPLFPYKLCHNKKAILRPKSSIIRIPHKKMEEETIAKFIVKNFNVIFPAILGVLGTLLGIFIAGLLNYFQNRSQQKSEERKHLANLTITAAIKHWERIHEGRKGEDIMPIDIYMVHMSKLAQEVLNDTITKENVGTKLKNIDDIVDAMKKYAASTIQK